MAEINATETPKKKKQQVSPPAWRRYAWLVLRVVFVIAIFTVVVRTMGIDFNDLREQARTINWWYVLLSFLIWVVAIYVASMRWAILLDVVKPGVSTLSLSAFNMVGIFYAQFLPGMVSGDVVKGYYLARDGEEKIKVMSSALMDRFLGIGVNGILGLVALAASPLVLETFNLSATLLWSILAIVIVGLAVGFAFVRYLERFEDRFPGIVKKLFEPIKLYARHPVALFGAAAMSIAYFLVWTAALWVLAVGVHIAHIGFFAILLLLAIVNVAQFLPISVNGAGVREAAVTVLLVQAYGIPEGQAFIYSLLIPLTALGLAAVGGLLVLTDYRNVGSVEKPE